jgi:ribosomal protein S18 acetylase RimI-like enzyme
MIALSQGPMETTIRPARPGDADALFDICLRTAESGADASALYSHPHYPGLVYAVPYLTVPPGFGYVLDTDGQVEGYIVGATDTARLEANLEARWWPKVRRDYAHAPVRTAHDRRMVGAIRAPSRADRARLADYPAHLHINLLPQRQGAGWGSRLVARFVDHLRAEGVRGLHLGLSATNLQALAFYRALGFVEIGRDHAIWMGMELSADPGASH